MTRASARVALAMSGVAMVAVACVWALGLRADARGWLRFDFAGTREPWSTIAAHNATLVGAMVLAAASLQWWPGARAACDVVLACVLAANAAIIGIAVGAYGDRLLRALALHGPFELLALSLAGGNYLTARREPLPLGALCGSGAVCAALLVGAALIETSSQIGGLQ